MTQDIQQSPLDLLAIALKHPSGQELVSKVYKLYQETQVQAHPNNQLVAIAIKLSKSMAPAKVPYFKSMTHDAIRKWIAEHS